MKPAGDLFRRQVAWLCYVRYTVRWLVAGPPFHLEKISLNPNWHVQRVRVLHMSAVDGTR